MFNKRSSSNNFDNIDLNNLKSYKPLNNIDDDDYNNYDNNFQNNIQPSKISSKNDVPIIKEMMEMDPKFMAIMKNRINGLSSVTKSYQSGRYEDSMIKAIESNDLGVINDCFRYSLIKKDLEKINLTIDMALKIFPNIIQMVNCKHDTYFKTGINTAWVVLNYFSEQIMQVLKTPVFNGVDLNREEKIRKYKILVDYFCKLRDNPRVQNNLKYKEIKNLNLKQFMGELNFFINQCQ
jgi:hypothetical protein